MDKGEFLKALKEKNPNDKTNKIITDEGSSPFISIDPKTGRRTEVATAEEDIRNRLTRAEKSGVPVELISTSPPEEIPQQERKLRENLLNE